MQAGGRDDVGCMAMQACSSEWLQGYRRHGAGIQPALWPKRLLQIIDVHGLGQPASQRLLPQHLSMPQSALACNGHRHGTGAQGVPRGTARHGSSEADCAWLIGLWQLAHCHSATAAPSRQQLHRLLTAGTSMLVLQQHCVG